jgi:hypothetical protein
MSIIDDVIGLIDTECSGMSTNDTLSAFKYGPPLRFVQNSPNRSFPATLKLLTKTLRGTGTENRLPPTLALRMTLMRVVPCARAMTSGWSSKASEAELKGGEACVSGL